MTPERWEQIGDLYERAIAVPAGERAALLDAACAGDPDLREEVEGMIAAYEADPDFLEMPALPHAGEAGGFAAEAFLAGEASVGPYRLLRLLGRGGMGTVYLAEATQNTSEDERKPVALKLLRAGLAHGESLRRFAAERDILGHLTHPHIARLLDAGQTESGQPYLVMEYVDGAPLTAYCDTHRLTVNERLGLFVQVCEAVQFAHSRLVIHRDLKPSNILVAQPSEDDPAAGHVKLLDFGIAKLLDPLALDVSLLETRTGQRLLTPSYASPEQIDGVPLTTASDVYSLGVLLYELLVGQRPYNLEGKTDTEIARIITEELPARPSSVVTGPASGRAASDTQTASEARRSSPARLQRRLQGDLDTIVLMALRKEPDRRYPSAAELAEDVRRHLRGLPVRARPDTVRYRMQKFVRRHRAGVAVAATFVLLLLAFAGAMTWQQAETARQRDRAERELATAQAVTTFLVDLFEANDPREARGDTVSARELLERGVARIDTLSAEPAVQARMLDVTGRIYRSLGEYDKAAPLIERALDERRRLLGPAHEDVAASLNQLANLRADQGQYDESVRLAQESLALYRTLLGLDHPGAASSLRQLATGYKHLGRYDEAEGHFRELLALERQVYDPGDPRLAITLNNFGRLMDAQFEYQAAYDSYREALAIYRQHFEEDHPDIIYTRSNIGWALIRSERYAEAVAELRDVVALRRQVLGPDHPGVATSLNGLATALSAQGDADEAIARIDEALAIYRTASGEAHPSVATTLYNRARMQHRAEHWEAAEASYREALALRRTALGEDHPRTALVAMYFGRLLHDRNAYGEAERHYVPALAVLTQHHGDEHRLVTLLHAWLADLYTVLDRPNDAARYASATAE